MGRKLDIKKGDTVYIKIESGSNAARRKNPFTIDTFDEWVKEVVVSGIGRKYITINKGEWSEMKFDIENDYREHYTYGGADWKLYKSKQEILDEMEYNNIYDNMKSIFGGYRGYGGCSLTLDQLRRINTIIKE